MWFDHGFRLRYITSTFNVGDFEIFIHQRICKYCCGQCGQVLNADERKLALLELLTPSTTTYATTVIMSSVINPTLMVCLKSYPFNHNVTQSFWNLINLNHRVSVAWDQSVPIQCNSWSINRNTDTAPSRVWGGLYFRGSIFVSTIPTSMLG